MIFIIGRFFKIIKYIIGYFSIELCYKIEVIKVNKDYISLFIREDR